MDKFIPYEKLSKKQRRELNAQRREMWAISPVTRKPANPKAYNRQKTRKWINDDSNSVSSVFFKKAPRFYTRGPVRRYPWQQTTCASPILIAVDCYVLYARQNMT